MKTFLSLLAMAGLIWVADAQEGQKEIPKPGKEHSYLKQFEGTWDAVSKMSHGDKAMESRGTETAKVDFDGYWLVIDFKGEHDGKPFVGHGSMGYDPMKKKYLLSWIDNMAPFTMWAEGTASADGKTFTFTHEGYCPELGSNAKFRTVMEFQDAGHRTLTFFQPGKDGPEKKMATIEYTRKS